MYRLFFPKTLPNQCCFTFLSRIWGKNASNMAINRDFPSLLTEQSQYTLLALVRLRQYAVPCLNQDVVIGIC